MSMNDKDKDTYRLHPKYQVLLGLVILLSLIYLADYLGIGLPLLRRYYEDTVTLKNTATGAVGILVDGQFQKDAKSPALFKNDEAFVSSTMPILVGHVDFAKGKNNLGAAYTNEVVGFGALRPMVIHDMTVAGNAAWSNKYDDLKLTFQSAPFKLPISVWVLYDKDGDKTIGKETKEMAAAIAKSNLVWKKQRMGLELQVKGADFHNALLGVNAKSSKYLNFTCGGPSLMDWKKTVQALEKDVGVTAKRINLYYVNKVDVGGKFQTFHGQSCWLGSNTVILGSNTGPDLLVHELGHNLNLQHPPPLSMPSKTDSKKNKFSLKNVMVAFAPFRSYLSEGQVFRAHVHPSSAVNDLYPQRTALGAAKGYPLRNSCSGANNDYRCPRQDKRIWANGLYHPAN
jgi:hypothetical protein